MRATRSASKPTPPRKKAVKVTPSKADQTEKRGNEPKFEESTSNAIDNDPEINLEMQVHDVGDEVTPETVNAPNREEVAPMEESSIDQIHCSENEGVLSVNLLTSTEECTDAQGEASEGNKVLHDYRLVQELHAPEGSEEQIDGLENEGEGYHEEDEADHIEEIEEEVEEAVEEEEAEGVEEVEGEEEVEGVEGAEEVEEVVIEEEGNEAEILEQRPVSERQKRKKFEVFVGGLDKNATEDDVRKAFETVGEVVEIRLMKHPQTGKNKGYAFVRFAAVEQAKKAATELGRTKICDKECGVVPSEDNDTLFVGNISKSWKKEQVLEKLKEYGVEGVEEVTLISDPRNEELNRGYAFLELTTHNDAIKAFVRLRKPDATFGYNRSVKVSWAEPLLDEDSLAKVKSVFVDVIPPSWDESKVREHFAQYGEIERVVLAKDNPKSKRNDYAFVDYASRESAVACVEALKSGVLVDGDTKVKVTVAFSKSLPREKNIVPSRSGYPVGGRSLVHGRGWASQRGSFGTGIYTGRGRGFPRGGRVTHAATGGGRKVHNEPRFIRGPRKHIPDQRTFYEDRTRFRPPAVVPPRSARGGVSRGAYVPIGGRNHPPRSDYEYSSSRGRGGSANRGRRAPIRVDYSSRGGRHSAGVPRGRGYANSPAPREDTYARMPERFHSYAQNVNRGYEAGPSDYLESGPGSKRPYAAMDEYYDAGARGYSRPRLDYGDPDPVTAGHYAESARAPLRSSLSGRSALPLVGNASIPPVQMQMYDQSGSMYASGGHGYPPAGTDYGASATDLRGGSYNSSAYGGRAGASYGFPGSSTGPYY